MARLWPVSCTNDNTWHFCAHVWAIFLVLMYLLASLVGCLSEHKMLLAQIKGYSFKGYMKIDHMAVSDDVRICKIEYVDAFKNLDEGIGIPDHKPILAEIELSSKEMKHDK